MGPLAFHSRNPQKDIRIRPAHVVRGVVFDIFQHLSAVVHTGDTLAFSLLRAKHLVSNNPFLHSTAPRYISYKGFSGCVHAHIFFPWMMEELYISLQFSHDLVYYIQ